MTQSNFDGEGFEGEDPELDRIARKVIDLREVERIAHKETGDAKDELKKKMLELEKDNITVAGVTFKIRGRQVLTVSGERASEAA